MSYRLFKWTSGNQGLYEVRGGGHCIIARQSGGVWKLVAGQRFLGDPSKEDIHQITEEEAAMILFQAREPA